MNMIEYRRDDKGSEAGTVILKTVFLSNAANVNLHIWLMIYLPEQITELYNFM